MIIKRKKEIIIIINSNLTVVLSVYAKPGGTPHMKGLGMILVVSFRGVNFGFWSHLGCSGQNAIIFSRGSRLGLHEKKYKNIYLICTGASPDMYIFNSFYSLHSFNPSFLICLCFNMVSFRGQKKLGPRPNRSLSGVFKLKLKLKISNEHPHPFHMQSLPPSPGMLSACMVFAFSV